MAGRTGAPARVSARRGVKRGIWLVPKYIILLFWAALVVFPLWWLITTSIKLPVDVNRGVGYIPGVDFVPTFETWDYLLFGPMSRESFPPFVNTVIIAVASAALAVALGSVGGYGLSRFKYRVGRFGNNDIAFWFIAQRMMPPVIVVFPLMIMFKTLYLLDSRIGLILVYSAFGVPLVVWLMRDFFATVPKEIEESALVDGCSRVQCFLRVALPVAAPGLVASYLLVLIYASNEYLLALLLTFKNAATMPIYIAGMTMSGKGTEWWYMSALTIFAVTPTVVLGLLLQKYLIKGIVMGSLKE